MKLLYRLRGQAAMVSLVPFGTEYVVQNVSWMS
jgi:hypothetical protein